MRQELDGLTEMEMWQLETVAAGKSVSREMFLGGRHLRHWLRATSLDVVPPGRKGV